MLMMVLEKEAHIGSKMPDITTSVEQGRGMVVAF